MRKFLYGLVAVALASAAAHAKDWPKSDVAPDPGIRQGVLANGMRYAILRNETPKGAVSVRFTVAVGSTFEAPDQRGFSHFVEHMAFRGSKNFPDGEINHSLERLGLRFGADTNASTSQYVTDYRFDLPVADAKAVAEALAIARDIAGNVSFDDKAVQTEAGVVMSEAAMRSTPAFRANRAELEFALSDPRAAAEPGGESGMVLHPKAADLRRYYRRWYWPGRAVLTVVGDIDPVAVEREINARFSDWQGVGEEGSEPVFQVPFDRSLEARVHVEQAVPDQVEMAWIKPPLVRPLSRAAWKELRIQNVALQIVIRRLSAMAASAQRPFLSAGAGRRDARHAARLFTLSAGFEAGGWQKALSALAEERLALLRTGVTQEEIDSIVAAQLAAQQRAVLSADSRTSPQLAGAIAGDAVADEVTTSPAQMQRLAVEDLAGLTPEIVGQALQDMFGAGEPLIFVSSHTPLKEEEVAPVYRAVADEARIVSTAAPRGKWPYTDFGAPGPVAESEKVPDLGITDLRFANNVRLLVRPSKERLNQVLVAVKLGDGRAGLAKDNAVANWIGAGLVPGGLGALSSTEIVNVLSGKSYRVGFGITDGAFVFTGETTPKDLETQLQIFAAYVKDPGFREPEFVQFRQRAVGLLRTAGATPQGVMGLRRNAILHGGDKRWAVPSADELKGATVDDLKALVQPLLKSAPMEVVIVGDTSVEEASRLVAATLGALPSRSPHPPVAATDDPIPFPASAKPMVLATDIPSDQALVNVAWPVPGLWRDLQDDASMRLLAAVLKERLLEDLRGRGLSYAVQVAPVSSGTFDFGYLSAAATMPAGQAQLFYDAVDKVVADLKSDPVSADEFSRSLNPIVQSNRRDVLTNDYWLALLSVGWDREIALDRARRFDHLVESLTPADVTAAARKYLTGGVRISAGS